MKLTIPRKDLVSALTIVKNAATGKGHLPILCNVALQAKGNKLHLSCTDLDIVIQTQVDANIDDEGKTTVNAALLYNLAQSFPESQTIELKALKSELAINSGDSKYKLSALSWDEVPPVSELKDPQEFTLPQLTLRRLLAETGFAQSSDDARYVLNSSFLSLNGALTVAACDGRRIAVEDADLEEKPGSKAEIILPIKAVKELLRLLQTEDEEGDKHNSASVTVELSNNLAKFSLGDTIITSKLIDGTYPNYRQVIPTDLVKAVPIARVDLLTIAKRISLVSDACSLEFAGQLLSLKGSGNSGAAAESLLIPKVARQSKVNMNVHYLIEALSAIQDDEIQFHPQGDNMPAVLKVAKKTWTCVIAPMNPDANKAPTDEEEPAKEPAAKK